MSGEAREVTPLHNTTKKQQQNNTGIMTERMNETNLEGTDLGSRPLLRDRQPTHRPLHILQSVLRVTYLAWRQSWVTHPQCRAEHAFPRVANSGARGMGAHSEDSRIGRRY